MKRWLPISLVVLILLGYSMITSDIPLDELKAKYANEQSQFISIRNIDVHFRDEGTGMPVVLLHGTASSLHTWDGWTRQLTDSFRVIRMDLPAFGLTGPDSNNDYSIKSYVDFLHDFLEQMDVDSMILAGNSLGGQIAWNYAAVYPNQIKKLILIDPSGQPMQEYPFVFTLAKTPVISHVIKYLTPRSLIEKNVKQVYFDDSKVTPELVDRYYELGLRQGNRQAFIDRAKMGFQDATDKLKTIKAPTLILWGANDEWIPFEHGRFFESDIPNSKLVILNKAGHVPMEERPEESLEIVRDFISN